MGVLLRLPDALRSELKEPFGPVYTDAEALLADAGEPVVAVGDVVTYHLLEAGHQPAVAIIDGKTEREAVDERISAGIGGFDDRVEVANPAATLTAALLEALVDALASEGSTVIVVTEGEEDLAAVPAIAAGPAGAAVVYGQPGEGMVLATVEDELAGRMRSLLARMEGDRAAVAARLGVEID